MMIAHHCKHSVSSRGLVFPGGLGKTHVPGSWSWWYWKIALRENPRREKETLTEVALPQEEQGRDSKGWEMITTWLLWWIVTLLIFGVKMVSLLLLSKASVHMLSGFLLFIGNLWSGCCRDYPILHSKQWRLRELDWLAKLVHGADWDLRLLDRELAPQSVVCLFNVTIVPWHQTLFLKHRPPQKL